MTYLGWAVIYCGLYSSIAMLIALVLFEGAGERAFCAGGDIQALYHAMVAHPGGPVPYAEDFFAREYRLDYLIHTYPKPTLVLGHGVVMGGGLGILGGCSHRCSSGCLF